MWAKCPTHGPIQDAGNVDPVDYDLFCRCGQKCSEFKPESFVDHDELKALQPTGKQPKEKK